MKTRNFTFLVLALMLATTSLAFAQRGGRGDCPQGREDGSGPHKARILERLDLSETQQAAIDKIHTESRETGLETRKRIMRLQNELEGLMLQDEPDTGEVVKLVSRIGELKTEQQVRRAQTRLEIREQLTEEQRDRMMTLRGDRGPRSGRHGQGHGPGSRGPRGGRF